MSRIAGLFAFTDEQADRTALAGVSGGLNGMARWRLHNTCLGRAAMIWVGRGEAQMIEADDVSAVVDGVFYNRAELGRIAGETGARDNDAALLVALYRRHGFEGALARVSGDFALALYDRGEETLWIARDRLGVKPLYYVKRTDNFAFASRLGALLRLPGVSREINHRFVAVFAASHYRYFDNVPGESPYAGISQLPAAHYLEIGSGKSALRRYWDLTDEPDFTEPEAELAEAYRDLLLDAVRRRYALAGRAAFTLSGGMDSSSVVSCAVTSSGKQQVAYSSVYADKTFDEREDIHDMLDERIASWHPVEVCQPDVFGIVRRMIAAHDEPVATATWLSHFLVCERVAADGYDTLFGGLGGDELNAGEYEHFFFHFADLRYAGRGPDLAIEIDKWAVNHDHPIHRKNRAVAEATLARLVDMEFPGRILPDRARMTRYYDALNPDFFTLSNFEAVMDHPFQGWLKNRSYQDLFRETTPCCLRAEDRQCAAFGLQHCDPFLDHRLVEFMFRVPGDMKIRNGITKRLLREAMRGVLPEKTRTRIKKTGWNAPAHIWFSDARLDDLRDLVRSQNFKEMGIYNIKVVEHLVDDHARIVRSGEPRENHMMFLWQLVNLYTWMDMLPSIASAQNGKAYRTCRTRDS